MYVSKTNGKRSYGSEKEKIRIDKRDGGRKGKEKLM